MAGRPRKVTVLSTGKIGKDNIQQRKTQESKLKLGKEQLTPPSWLSVDAQREFTRVVEEVSKIDILDNLDLGVLAVYCNAYSNYKITVDILREEGNIITKETSHGVSQVVNPALKAQETYIRQIMQCSTKLGLATTDRLKLVVPVKKEDNKNKFIDLLERKNG